MASSALNGFHDVSPNLCHMPTHRFPAALLFLATGKSSSDAPRFPAVFVFADLAGRPRPLETGLFSCELEHGL